jgi:hypothetical protein
MSSGGAGRGSGLPPFPPPPPHRHFHDPPPHHPGHPAAVAAAAAAAGGQHPAGGAVGPIGVAPLQMGPLPVLHAPPSMLASRPRYMPPILGGRTHSLGASPSVSSSLGTGASGGGTSATPTLHNWFAGFHSNSSGRSERSLSRSSAGVPAELRDLFTAAPVISFSPSFFCRSAQCAVRGCCCREYWHPVD